MGNQVTKPIQVFDISSQEFKANPFPTLARMREAGPVVRTKLPIIGKLWMVTTYDAVNELLRDHHRFVRSARSAGKNKFVDFQWWLSQLFRAPAENMLAKDEPDHRRLRGLVEDAFQRRSVEGMRSRLRLLADELLDQALQDAGAAHAIEFLNFSRQFPLAVICELLGLPEEDWPKFTRWASGISKVNSLPGMLKLLPNMLRTDAYFRRQFRICRERPTGGLLALLVEAEHAGDSLSEDELASMAFLLLFAGHETTTHLISGGLLTLLDHPEQKAELMSDWRKGGAVVDEILRFYSPVQFTKPRLASCDLEFCGQRIRRGEYLIAMLAAANSDPDKFDAPHCLDINRRPNPHVGFGSGIHVCLGLKLARMEAEVVFEQLLTRCPHLELAIPRSMIAWTKRIGIRALESLPVVLHA